MLVLASLGLLIALGVLEHLSLRRARSAVPIRIHVNGTRGKSTVTRLIAGALREAGISTLAKVTGTSPRVIFPDGTEAVVPRRGPANVREQMWFLRVARRTGVKAVVVECMAVRPDLQWTSEHRMLRATIGVITNARLDHTEEMGETVEQIAQSLANTIPSRGVLVSGCVPHSSDVDEVTPSWLSENIATALAVTRQLGIDDEIALRGMRKAAPDPGAVSSGTAAIAGREIEWLDATAANDPESFDLLASTKAGSLKPKADLIVYNHRSDRPDRLHNFARASHAFRSSPEVLLTGERPALSLMAAVRRLCAGSQIHFVPRRDLAAAIEGKVDTRRVLFCGNTRGFENPLRKSC